MNEQTAEQMIHPLWGKAKDAAGTVGYDKNQWINLQRAIERLEAENRDLRAAVVAKDMRINELTNAIGETIGQFERLHEQHKHDQARNPDWYKNYADKLRKVLGGKP